MSGQGPLAILCGGGGLATAAAREAAASGREVFLIGLVGSASIDIEVFPHIWLKLGEVGRLFSELQTRGVREMAILGAVSRPEFADLKLDWGAVRRAGEIAKLFRGGDNRLLSGVARMIEAEGVRIVGVKDFAPTLITPAGVIAGREPDSEAMSDIRFAASLLASLSPFDVGQGAVVARERTLAVEAAEGTDAMLRRVADLRAAGRLKLKGRVGVFVKAAKRGQDLRLDLPTVGPQTLEAAARAELSGIALAAGEVLLAERAKLIAAAEAAGLFIYGWTA